MQELGDTSIRGSRGEDGPAYGRRYDIFYNQFKIGLLEICAGLGRKDKTVDVEVTINRIIPTMLPYSSVSGFLQTVASLVASTDRPKYLHLLKGETEYEHAMSTIRGAIAALMWEMHQEDHPFPELQIELSGTPDYYYELLQIKLDEDKPKPAPEHSVAASPERSRFAKMWSQRL